ncbi:UBP1-associated protein 2C, partial [Fagus crenata]
SLSFFSNGPDLKRKLEENGIGLITSDIDSSVPKLTLEDVRKIVDKEKLIDIVADATSTLSDRWRIPLLPNVSASSVDLVGTPPPMA